MVRLQTRCSRNLAYTFAEREGLLASPRSKSPSGRTLAGPAIATLKRVLLQRAQRHSSTLLAPLAWK